MELDLALTFAGQLEKSGGASHYTGEPSPPPARPRGCTGPELWLFVIGLTAILILIARRARRNRSQAAAQTSARVTGRPTTSGTSTTAQHHEMRGDGKTLISCPDCGHAVSRKALACPGCGSPIQELVSGQVHVRRKFSALGGGSGTAISVWCDGKAVGQIDQEGQSFSFRVPAGQHTVEVRTNDYSAAADFALEPGATVVLEGGFGALGNLGLSAKLGTE